LPLATMLGICLVHRAVRQAWMDLPRPNPLQQAGHFQ
jgi:hypothetical protein